VAALGPVMAGILLGQRLRRHVPPARFRLIVGAIVLISGVTLVARAL
jgi:uncharacterized membrane protein YfcA